MKWTQAGNLIGASLWAFLFWLSVFGTIFTRRIYPGAIMVIIISPILIWYSIWSYKRVRAGRWIHKWGFW